nr:MAG TPA: hypothetical protein [Bacteriophage sp.]
MNQVFINSPFYICSTTLCTILLIFLVFLLYKQTEVILYFFEIQILK